MKYQIERTIGKGGMATVYLATAPGRRTPVALKMMSLADGLTPEDPEATMPMKDTSELERFKREAQVLRKLKHTNIVRVLDWGREGSDAFLAMEYLPGGDLSSHIGDGLPVRQALEFARQLATALGIAHAAGVCHRDVKPANVLLRDDKTVVLTDFGIAQVQSDVSLTRTGTMMGSPCYASPEQLEASGIDHRTDLYSLGLVLFEMLTGARAMDGTTPMEVMIRQVRGPIPMLQGELSVLQPLLDRMLAKRAEDRFADTGELVTQLGEYLETHGDLSTAPVATPSERPRDELTAKISGTVEHCREGLFEDLLADRLVLPTLPSAAARVRTLAESPDSSIDEIAIAVALEPALSAQLMRVANSAYYGGGRVRDLHAAIMRLGTRALQHIVMLLLVSRLFDESVDARLREHLHVAWQRSLRTAVLAETLAAKYRVCEPAEAMLAGLLADIGNLPVLAWAIDVPHVRDSPRLLRAVMQRMRPELGRAMLERWDYPAEFLAVAGAERSTSSLPPPDMLTSVNCASALSALLDDEAALAAELARLGAEPRVAETIAARAVERLGAFVDATVAPAGQDAGARAVA